MLVLGIETSTPQASVAIGSEQGVVSGALHARGAGYSEWLLPAVQSCLDNAHLTYNSLGGIAVSLGPGLFSGMRVGVASAKALAQALSLPIVGWASLDLLAYEVRYSAQTICAVLDARRNEVFSAFYRPSPGGVQRMTDYRVDRPEQLAVTLDARPEDTLMVGNGALLYRRVFESVGPEIDIGGMGTAFPSATALVELALPRLMRGETDLLNEVKPLYLRRSARPIHWDRIRGRRTA